MHKSIHYKKINTPKKGRLPEEALDDGCMVIPIEQISDSSEHHMLKLQ